jgi:DNA mismatch repair ATPase MutS
MKAFLMYADRDFSLQQKPQWNDEVLLQDLELTTLFSAMAQGDEFLFEVTRSAVFSGLDLDVSGIVYRQDILKDCLRNPLVVKGLYELSIRAIETPKRISWGIFGMYPDSILSRSIDILGMLVTELKDLRNVAIAQDGVFESGGFKTLFAMLKRELSDDYFAKILEHLKELKFRGGVLISAELGKGNKGINYILRKSRDGTQNWLTRVLANRPTTYSYRLHPRDDQGARALSELKDRGIHLAANALAQATDHILSFFQMLRTELGFYVGCLNLHDQLTKKGEPICIPIPVESAGHGRSFRGLYDVCLSLHSEGRVVGNDLKGNNKELVIITGANQGGKSTFLRSVGLAQLMMQCGMFVAANSFSGNICDALFTHFTRAEDVTMKSGKLDEELSRMNEIIDHLTANSMILLNESFAATNEREGSEIARQIISALSEKKVQILFVTHLFTFARDLHDKNLETAVFLRAERKSDGSRTFKVTEGEPLETSYGEDLYRELFLADS